MTDQALAIGFATAALGVLVFYHPDSIMISFRRVGSPI
jgi:hypothetical protein